MKKAWKIPDIGEKPRWVIVDENDKIINKNPSKEDLKGLQQSILRTYRSKSGCYNDTNTCDRCGKSFSEIGWGNPRRECDKDGNPTGKWDCPTCYQKYDPNSTYNILKPLGKRRKGYQDPNHGNTKGDKIQELARIEFGWIDLNKERDNYMSPIDFFDPKTGLFYQVRGRWYDPKDRSWRFADLKGERIKNYEDMVCYCMSNDGKRVERIYIIPFWEIEKRTCISIMKNPTNCVGIPIIPWYEKYRVIEEKELYKANEIWKEINKE